MAVVTGAAGGIGLAVCAGLAAAGWAVAATDLPGTSVRYEADLRDPAAAGALIGAVTGDHGRLDLLVNNAATMYHGELRAGDLDRWWDTIEVNLSAPFRLARAAVGHLRATRGQIINMASILGVTGEAGFSAYCASKSGIIGLTKSLARELAPEVRVNAIAPGDVDTPQQAVDAAAYGLTREELYARHARTVPIGRVLEPAEISRLICYLAGETGYTGSCIHLNGGRAML
ncbi:MAG TPA: SDR family NAD(P)-dependent oxidoreductase [Streptosporangiaceae bacterium]